MRNTRLTTFSPSALIPFQTSVGALASAPYSGVSSLGQLLCLPPPSPHSFGRNFLSTGLSAFPRHGAGPCRPQYGLSLMLGGPHPALQGLRSALACQSRPRPRSQDASTPGLCLVKGQVSQTGPESPGVRVDPRDGREDRAFGGRRVGRPRVKSDGLRDP